MVYPFFGADESVLSEAASGLKELGGDMLGMAMETNNTKVQKLPTNKDTATDNNKKGAAVNEAVQELPTDKDTATDNNEKSAAGNEDDDSDDDSDDDDDEDDDEDDDDYVHQRKIRDDLIEDLKSKKKIYEAHCLGNIIGGKGKKCGATTVARLRSGDTYEIQATCPCKIQCTNTKRRNWKKGKRLKTRKKIVAAWKKRNLLKEKRGLDVSRG